LSGASPHARPALRQLLRFGLVGVANTVLCLVILWTLHDRFGLAVWLASAIGYAIAIVQSYVLNRSWTFAGGAAVPVGRQLPMFIAVSAAAGVMFSALTSGLAPVIGLRAGSLLAVVATTFVSFLAQRTWVFGQGGKA
jgi:putative flippase GtrA